MARRLVEEWRFAYCTADCRTTEDRGRSESCVGFPKNRSTKYQTIRTPYHWMSWGVRVRWLPLAAWALCPK